MQSVLDEDVVNQFYRYFFDELKNETKYPIREYNSLLYMTDLLANINRYAYKEENRTYFFRQPFKTAALKFKVFDDNNVDVIVPYKEEGIRLIEKLRKADQKKDSTLRGLSKEILQEIKPYTINIFQYQKNQMEEYGLLEHLFDGRILILDGKAYHDDYGLRIISEPKVESYIF
jgi:hypothetical protein